MAYFDFYAPIDMIGMQVWPGYVQNASSSNIGISDGYRTANYYPKAGAGFTFSPLRRTYRRCDRNFHPAFIWEIAISGQRAVGATH